MKRWCLAGVLLALLLAPSVLAAARESTIHLSGAPTDVVYAAGSLWVTSVAPEELLRLDPASGRVLTRIRLPSVNPLSQLAVAGGSVWVTNTGSAVYRIDIRTGKLVARIHLRIAAVGVAAGAGSLWVTAPGQSRGIVFRIDPATNRVVKRLHTSAGIGPVAYAGGSVWVIDTSGPARGLLRIDPRDDRLRGPPPGLGGAIVAPVTGTSRYLWIEAGGGSFLRYDTRTGKEALVRLRGAKAEAVAFAVAPHAVWVANYRDSTLTRIAYR